MSGGERLDRAKYGCTRCDASFATTRERTIHENNVHGTPPSAPPAPGAPAARGRGLGWCLAVAVLAVVLGLVWSRVGGDDGVSDAELLEDCDHDRELWVSGLDPAFRDDPAFHWEAAQVPLESIEGRHTYDTGVIEVTGSTNGIEWGCLHDPMGQTTWSWEDP